MATLPTAFAHYNNVTFIGKGAFGEVYRATDTKLRRDVALKTPHPFLLIEPAFVQEFMREAQVAAGLIHPNIVRVYQVAEYQGVPYIEMEFVEGNTLEQEMESRKFIPKEELLPIVEQICAGLDFAHKQKLVHGDLKPGNVLLGRTDGESKRQALLADFGLAQALDESQKKSFSERKTLVGTARYMAPEQFDEDGGRSSPQTDIYSLGVIVYQLVTGCLPFDRTNFIKLGYAHVHETPQPPSALVSKLSKKVDDVILKAMAKQPEDRYQTASEFYRELRAALKPKVEALNVQLDSANKERSVVRLPWEQIIAAVAAFFVLTISIIALWVQELPPYVGVISAVLGMIAALVILYIAFQQLRSAGARPGGHPGTHGVDVNRSGLEVVAVVGLVVAFFGLIVLLAYFRWDGLPPPPTPTPLPTSTPSIMATTMPRQMPTQMATTNASVTLIPTPDLLSNLDAYLAIESQAFGSPETVAMADLERVATGPALAQLLQEIDKLRSTGERQLVEVELVEVTPFIFDETTAGAYVSELRTIQSIDASGAATTPKIIEQERIYGFVNENGNWKVDQVTADIQ